ncbi:unnamed protein product (macronuclear) [Paramecium tetraurelia]|uniref:Protein kinase domain-containing protein n=1 Tax=Paramecium tetraurelia TaxID=5888 RepID=A0CPM9_PARTE|nr:uncharacterized protein GSPATT00009138001 [Paramecium tetraurelia]CAK72746.1 unnamed protein product [Paramecium tetraurelia]|eukprot:XP_001440143.1 hypothetical protein (macronuclear) [Paramecium tetraurelia strain d4-2]
MIYSCQVIRKHFLLNQTYRLQIQEEKLLIGLEDRPAKYELDINLQNKISWKVSDQGIIQAFGIKYQNSCKWFYGQPSDLLQIKSILNNRIFFHSISNFYTSNEQIGSGASCKVLLISDIQTKQKYAAKCISKDYITKKKTPDRLNRLFNEINILRSIQNHKNIVKLIDIFEGEQTYYLVFEYLEGETLHRFLKLQTDLIPDISIRIILLQLLHGINSLHSENYIHRDIKLENIVLSKPSVISSLKLIDFGLAISNTQPVSFAVCGTPGYIAPEILQHDESKQGQKFKFTFKVDMFGIGVILYRLMNRQPLFESDKTKDLLQQNKKCHFTKNYHNFYTNALNQVLFGLLEVNPNKRLSSEEAIQFLTSQQISKEIGGSFATTKSHQNEADEFEVEQTMDHANQPYPFSAKILKQELENSYHQNDDNRLLTSMQRSYYPSFSLNLSCDLIDSFTQQISMRNALIEDEIIESDIKQKQKQK